MKNLLLKKIFASAVETFFMYVKAAGVVKPIAVMPAVPLLNLRPIVKTNKNIPVLKMAKKSVPWPPHVGDV